MSEFRLSQRAERDLLDIYRFSAETFGAYQAEAYLAGLERTFDLLAHFPRIGEMKPKLAPEVRRFRFQSHHVFYTEDTRFVLIRAILHTRRAIKTDLFK